ncbi:CinA family nicotinamide mononucleotide deamidase-related protein [Coraliomargarita parva]|uniref:CinA family nicotinamide mononucleotide deamidase-related protein n=1 Tax=Coraliomargarita parva TaxID=3014050 RepID=UPI0022B42816|nr:CinA family nicotinamide mononucleotide deamidase-related protein [Coraliomargarita parva]
MSKAPTVEVINFGDELLVGIRENAHLTYLGEQLARYGVPIARSRVITDDPEEIKRAFHDAWAHADLVITTGGLGPTADDLTRESIAEALEAKLVYIPEIESCIRDRFALLGREMSDSHKRQCYGFEGGEVLHNERGTAPGLLYATGGRTLAMLPGPTHELRPMFEKVLLPKLQAAGLLAEEQAYVQIRTCGVGESSIEELLQPLFAKHPDATVAYCVHYGMVDVRLSSRNGHLGLQELKEIAQEARLLLGEDFVCFGHCSLAEVVYHELRALERTVAVAESCTGGLLGNAFTDIPGASKVFRGGIVCYTNDVKMAMLDIPECLLDQHGAVSPECAVAMASGAAEKLSADYGLSVTGFAGPDGGDSRNPIGTIHLGYHSPVGVWCKSVRYVGGRLDVKARAVHAALDWMRRKLRKYKIEEFLCCGGEDD